MRVAHDRRWSADRTPTICKECWDALIGFDERPADYLQRVDVGAWQRKWTLLRSRGRNGGFSPDEAAQMRFLNEVMDLHERQRLAMP
jgi:hypothetical protein